MTSTARATWQYVAAVAWLIFTVALASWWFIFALSQARQIDAIEGHSASARTERMLMWEGGILGAMLVGGGAALVAAIRSEQRRQADTRAFFMAFTHDLKTSLASLRLQAEALREDLPQAAENRNLQRLWKDAVRLQLQLENALFFARTDGALLIEAIDVRGLIDQLREDWPELVVHIEGEAWVRGDRRALSSVLRNLLQNAVIHGRARTVSVRCRRAAPARMLVTVTDDGTGGVDRAPVTLDRPFVRSPATSGSGVGLFVSRSLVAQMQGTLRLLPPAPGFAVAIELPEAV